MDFNYGTVLFSEIFISVSFFLYIVFVCILMLKYHATGD